MPPLMCIMYWDLTGREITCLLESERCRRKYKHFYSSMGAAVMLMIESDRPIGVNLSGGTPGRPPVRGWPYYITMRLYEPSEPCAYSRAIPLRVACPGFL